MKALNLISLFFFLFILSDNAKAQSISVPNDGCGNPSFIEVSSPSNIVEVDYNLVDADSEFYSAPDPYPHGYLTCAATTVYTIKDVWFEFTAPASGIVQISTDADNIGLYTQCIGAPIDCSSDSQVFYENLIPGQNYLINLFDYAVGSTPSGNVGTISITEGIEFELDCPPARITEIKYQDSQDDIEEFIEVTAFGGESLAGYSIEIGLGPNLANLQSVFVFDGNSTPVPNTEISLDTILFPEDYTFLEFTFTSYLPNSSSFIALRDPQGVIIDLLSYGGTFVVDGFLSKDIGVEQNAGDPIDMSLRSQDIVGHSQWARSTANSPNEYNAELAIVTEVESAVWSGGSGLWADSNWETDTGTTPPGLRIFNKTSVSIPSGTVTIDNVANDGNECYNPGLLINETTIKNLIADGDVVLNNNGELNAQESLIFNGNLDISTALVAPVISAANVDLGNGSIVEVDITGDVSFSNTLLIEIDGLAGQGVAGGHDFLNVDGDLDLSGSINIAMNDTYAAGTTIPIISYETFDQSIDESSAPPGWIFENDETTKTISLLKQQRPVNDICDGAISIPLSADATTTSLTSESNEYSLFDDDDSCGDASSSIGVWYAINVTENATYSLVANNTSNNLRLQLFEGSCDNLTSLICGGDELAYEMESSKSYFVLVSTLRATFSTYDLTLLKYESPYTDILPIGINIEDPTTTLDVNGSLRIGNDSTALPGVMRFTKNSFQGFTGTEWKSLDLSNDNLGNHKASTNLDMSGNAIQNITQPIENSDAANKSYVDNHEDADADPENELQSLFLSGNNLSLTKASGSINIPFTSWSDISGMPSGFSDNTDDVDDADNDPDNEIISNIQLSNNTLTIDEGTASESIDLTPLASQWSDLANDEIHYSDGQVGIGLNSGINDRLHIRSTSGENALRVQVGSATKLRVYENGGISLGSNPSNIGANNVYIFDTLGVGEIAPEEKLHVNGGVLIKKNSASGDPTLNLLETSESGTAEDFIRLYMENESGNRAVIAGRPRTNTDLSTMNFFLDGAGDIIKLYGNNRVSINRTSASHPLHIGGDGTNGNGAHLTAGGTWTNGSSRSFKTDFQSVKYKDILTKLAAVDILLWNYKDSDEGQHLGPIAEDFYEAFGLGDNEKYISTVDADGVALAAIKGLYLESKELREENNELKDKVAKQEAMLSNLLERIEKLEK